MMKSILFAIVIVFTQMNCSAKKEEATAVSFSLNTGDRERHFFVASSDSDVRNALRADTVLKKWVEMYKTYLISKSALEYFAQYINTHRVEGGKPMLTSYGIRMFSANGKTAMFCIYGDENIAKYNLGLKRWMENSPYKREYKDILSDIEGSIRIYGNK